MTAPHWVLDTNVLVSAAITPGGTCDQLLQYAVAGHFIPAWDNTILSEYRQVLARPKFGLFPENIRNLLAAFSLSGFHRGMDARINLPDAADIPFVTVALNTNDKTIITGNTAHFPTDTMARYEVTIFTPRLAIENLEKTPWARN